jgi:hypothetical protein
MAAAIRVASSQSWKDTTTGTNVSNDPASALPKHSIRFYPFDRHWTKRIMPHLGDEELNDTLVRDFNMYTRGRWRKRFLPGMFPDEFECCDWRREHRGPAPRYWRYVKHGACHWLVNFALRLAMLTEPNRQWRIVTSDKHSAVWDGQRTLFDLQYYSLGLSAADSWAALSGGHPLRTGEYRKVYEPSHYTAEWQQD